MCPMSVNLPIHPVSTCLSTCLNILCTHPLTYIIINACIHPCIYASMHACMHPSRDHLFIYPFSDYAFVYPLPSTHTTIYPAHLSICPSTYLPTHLSSYPPIHLPTHPSTHLSILPEFIHSPKSMSSEHNHGKK